jgi:hypothetical protein
MDTSHKDVAKRVRSAKNWLERAEKSFDEKSDIKGEMNLMLAEAEMQNLRRNHGVGNKIIRVGALLTAIVLAAGMWYAMDMRHQADPVVRVSGPGTMASAGNPQWVKTPALVYSDVSAQGQADVVSQSTAVPVAVVQEPAAPQTEAASTVSVESERSTAVVAERPVSKTVLTDRQVEAAVQDARHSLRGK